MAIAKQRERMPRRRDDESGQYTPVYGKEDFIDAIEDRGGTATTPEITDSLGCSTKHALTRLQELEEEGSIRSRKVGNSYLWKLDDE